MNLKPCTYTWATPAMAKQLQGILISSSLNILTPSRKNNRVFLNHFSTIKKITEDCDLFEYTSGQWMHVASRHIECIEPLDWSVGTGCNDALRHRPWEETPFQCLWAQMPCSFGRPGERRRHHRIREACRRRIQPQVHRHSARWLSICGTEFKSGHRTKISGNCEWGRNHGLSSLSGYPSSENFSVFYRGG